jgi:hypothetical protein
LHASAEQHLLADKQRHDRYAATTDSQSGGAGGAAENWTIDTSTVGTLPFQDNGDPNNPISPINLLSIGHADDE